MTAATPRTAQGTPDLRRIGVAVGALTLAVALLVGVAVVRQAGGSSATTPAQSDNLIVTGTNGGGINYTGIPYPAPVPAPKALPGLHGNATVPDIAIRGDMSSAAHAAMYPPVPDIAIRGDMSSAARAAMYPAAAALPSDINAALYAAQQQAAADMSAAAYAAQHPASAVRPRSVASAIYEAQQQAPSQVSSALYAALNSAPALLPSDINAAIFAAQQQAAAEMSSDAAAALNSNQETTSAAIAARDALKHGGGESSSATTGTHADMGSPSFQNHRAR
jgi:hypothetical protein